MLRITKEQVIDGLIDHVDVSGYTEIKVSDLGLKKLPCWPNVAVVYCCFNQLTELPC